MEISDRRLNMIRTLYIDLGNLSNANDLKEAYTKKFGLKVGNIYEDLNDLIKLGLVDKNTENKTYQVSALGENLIRSRGNIPEVQIIYKNVIVDKVKVYPLLYERMKAEARREKQTVPEWILGVFEILTDSKEEEHEEEGHGNTGDNQGTQM